MIKKTVRLVFLLLLSFLALYLAFVAIISIVTGLTSMEKSGFWMPLLCGALLLYLAVLIARFIIYIVQHMKAKERYPYQ